MDKAGRSTRIEFSAIEGQANLKRRFMVGLDFPQTENDSIENAIQQKKVPLQIQVFAIDHGQTVAIPTEDDQAIVAAAHGQAPSNTSLATLNLYGTDGKTSNVLVAGFYLPHYGHYVAVVKTIKDLPMFKNVRTQLKVDAFYNPGE